ncbi:hypothetical protein HDV00_005034, partial [Rhizophlyctis rosea]
PPPHLRALETRQAEDNLRKLLTATGEEWGGVNYERMRKKGMRGKSRQKNEGNVRNGAEVSR